jgi:hypothetical protein
MIEDVAEDVNILIEKDKMEYQLALVKVLKERNLIERDSDEDTINLWDDTISHIFE